MTDDPMKVALKVVALRIRQHSFTAIARVVGLSRQNCQKAFVRALHRSTTVDIHTHHRTELAELEGCRGPCVSAE